MRGIDKLNFLVRHQKCGPKYPGAISELWLQNFCIQAWVEDELFHPFNAFGVQLIDIAYPATQNNHFRIEDIDQIGDAFAKKVQQSFDGCAGMQVTIGFVAFQDFFELEFLAGLCQVKTLQGRA